MLFEWDGRRPSLFAPACIASKFLGDVVPEPVCIAHEIMQGTQVQVHTVQPHVV